MEVVRELRDRMDVNGFWKNKKLRNGIRWGRREGRVWVPPALLGGTCRGFGSLLVPGLVENQNSNTTPASVDK